MSQTRCALYLRISLDHTGEGLAVARQRDDCLKIAADRGWEIVAEYKDTVSAYDRRKQRPNYDAMVADYQTGKFDAIVVWDLDRLTRQPRQLEDWIDAADERGLKLVTANGEADLSTDGGRMYARVKAAVARSESERKAARQRAAARQRSELGKPPLGVRLSGYTSAGETVEHEAETIRQIFAQFYAGSSLYELAKWLNETAVPTRNGRRWNPSSVRTTLTNPRYAGRAIYQGEVIGRPGNWEALVDETVFDVVNEKLADPRRRKQQGTDRRYLGSGLYRCAVCDDSKLHSHTSSTTGPRYRCPVCGHSRTAAPVDRLVLAVLRGRLAMPDLAGLLTVPESEEAQAAAAEIRRLRRRLERVQADYDDELIDGPRYKAASQKAQAELDAAEAARLRLLGGSGIASVLGAPDPVTAFDEAPLGIQRAVVEFFVSVRLKPAPRGHKFNPESVEIAWNHA